MFRALIAGQLEGTQQVNTGANVLCFLHRFFVICACGLRPLRAYNSRACPTFVDRAKHTRSLIIDTLRVDRHTGRHDHDTTAPAIVCPTLNNVRPQCVRASPPSGGFFYLLPDIRRLQVLPLPVRTYRPICRPTRGRRPRKKKALPLCVQKKKPPRFGRVAVVFYLYPSPMAVGAFFFAPFGVALFFYYRRRAPAHRSARHGGRACGRVPARFARAPPLRRVLGAVSSTLASVGNVCEFIILLLLLLLFST